MFGLFDAIADWFRGLLIDGITFNFIHMFTEANREINEIAGTVGETPAGWNAGIFALIQNLSETVIIPIAGVILTFILCYELIHMIIERNNMHDFDTFMIFKWIFKSFCAVLILTNTFNIVMFVFGLAQSVVDGSAGIITGSLDMDLALSELEAQLEAMSIGGLLGLYLQSAMLSLAMNVLSLCVFLIVYGRMIEIYLTISVAPIPMSTMVNREWGNTIVLYEAFRPFPTQVQVYNVFTPAMRNAFTAPWTFSWFLSTPNPAIYPVSPIAAIARTSNHQRGIAVDVGLRVIGGAAFEMPTPMHELSPQAVVFTTPGGSTFSPGMQSSEGAMLLNQYFTAAGFTPLSSEWWHFDDNNARAIVNPGSVHSVTANLINGNFFTPAIYSIPVPTIVVETE